MSIKIATLETARLLDQQDDLSRFRDQFHIPRLNGNEDIYFVGNSLGLQPKRTADYVGEELERWRELGVRGHFTGERPWMAYHECLAETMAELVGANVDEVVTMNSLTVNLHLMMATFYRPTDARHQILIESHAFPSDKNAVESQIRLHGYTPVESLIEVTPEPGKSLISTEQICQTIEDHSDTLALILLPGVQYYSGQVFDMRTIADVAHSHGIVAGFDLAHAAGNIAMELHEWGVDFACWCSYKYLNSGPGSLAGCFVHEKHASQRDLNRLAGWWGHDKSTRFQMSGKFSAIGTAEGWQVSNPSILSLAAVRASLDVFKDAGGMSRLVGKSQRMGQFFRDCLDQKLGDRVDVIAPVDVSGCQISLVMNHSGSEHTSTNGKDIHDRLDAHGIRTDWREPNVIRAAPVPLYNTYEEVWRFVDTLAMCHTGIKRSLEPF